MIINIYSKRTQKVKRHFERKKNQVDPASFLVINQLILPFTWKALLGRRHYPIKKFVCSPHAELDEKHGLTSITFDVSPYVIVNELPN